MAAIIASVPAIDATLEGAAKSTLGKLQHDITTLRARSSARQKNATKRCGASSPARRRRRFPTAFPRNVRSAASPCSTVTAPRSSKGSCRSCRSTPAITG